MDDLLTEGRALRAAWLAALDAVAEAPGSPELRAALHSAREAFQAWTAANAVALLNPWLPTWMAPAGVPVIWLMAGRGETDPMLRDPAWSNDAVMAWKRAGCDL